MPQSVFSFCLGTWPFLLLTSSRNLGLLFFLPYPLFSLAGLSLRFLMGLSDSYLIDLGSYEVAAFLPFGGALGVSVIVFWALVLSGANLSFFFSPVAKKEAIIS